MAKILQAREISFRSSLIHCKVAKINKDAPKSPTAKIRENKDTPKPPTSKKKENMNNNNIFSFFGGSESDKDRNAPPSTSMTQQVKIIEKQESWLDSLFVCADQHKA